LVSEACSEDPTRDILNYMRVTPTETMAVDGHLLFRVTRPDIKADEFPCIDGITPETESRDFFIHRTQIDKLKKAIPKSKHLPIIENILVGHSENGTVPLAVTDLESPQIFQMKQPEAETFPDIDRVTPMERPVMNWSIDIDKLLTIDKVAKAFQKGSKGLNTISFHFHPGATDKGNWVTKATTFNSIAEDGQELNGLIMPCHPNDTSVERLDRVYPKTEEKTEVTA